MAQWSRWAENTAGFGRNVLPIITRLLLHSSITDIHLLQCDFKLMRQWDNAHFIYKCHTYTCDLLLLSIHSTIHLVHHAQPLILVLSRADLIHTKPACARKLSSITVTRTVSNQSHHINSEYFPKRNNTFWGIINQKHPKKSAWNHNKLKSLWNATNGITLKLPNPHKGTNKIKPQSITDHKTPHVLLPSTLAPSFNADRDKDAWHSFGHQQIALNLFY
jgi:hypothetical protein